MQQKSIGIETLAYGGDGVGHLADGRVAFIAGALPGDTVAFRTYENKERFVKGVVEEILQASQVRVLPVCEEARADRCGGCPWGCLAYDEQLKFKRSFVVDSLARIAKLGEEEAERLVAPCKASSKQWHYRNKVEFEVGQDVAGRFTLGMHARAGAFVPLASCQLCDEKFAAAPKALTGALRYAAGTADLGIQRVGLRHSKRTGETELAIWTQTGRFPRAHVAKLVTSALPVKQLGVMRVLLKGAAKARKVSGCESLAGRGCWSERVLGRQMWFSAPSFFQVNTAGAEELVRLVMDGLQPNGLDFVLDLYSGAGTFTLPLAQEAGQVAAVEMVGFSVRDLRRNLERNELRADVIGGDAARELASLGAVDKVVVDPPRSGLGVKAAKGLLATRAHRIAYVSCDPATLARDMAQLLAGGYKLLEATPVDLFPQTYHVETVAILER